MDECSFAFTAAQLSSFSPATAFSTPLESSLSLTLILSTLCFIISTVSSNYSQVDKIWSITPILYAFLPLLHSPPTTRSVIMALLPLIWGSRLTWNFNRRGGYHFPRFWEGEEDYRWPLLREGVVPYLTCLDRPLPWFVFNLTFISFYQNILLWLTACPAIIVWIVESSTACPSPASPFAALDAVAAALYLFFIFIEAKADNEQYQFQTEKYRRISNKEKLSGDYKDGYCQSGLYSIVRKPNYAAEQSIWVVYYLFSVSATGALLNWSASGCVLLCMLFQGSGWMTELISKKKYPKYGKKYCERVGLYLPFRGLWTHMSISNEKEKKEEKEVAKKRARSRGRSRTVRGAKSEASGEASSVSRSKSKVDKPTTNVKPRSMSRRSKSKKQN